MQVGFSWLLIAGASVLGFLATRGLLQVSESDAYLKFGWWGKFSLGVFMGVYTCAALFSVVMAVLVFAGAV